LFIHITLETAPNEMQCDETISHMVTAGRSYFCTLRNLTQFVRVMVLSFIFTLRSISLLFLRLTIIYEVFQ